MSPNTLPAATGPVDDPLPEPPTSPRPIPPAGAGRLLVAILATEADRARTLSALLRDVRTTLHAGDLTDTQRIAQLRALLDAHTAAITGTLTPADALTAYAGAVDHEPPPPATAINGTVPAAVAPLAVLVVDDRTSRCAACGHPALPTEPRHITVPSITAPGRPGCDIAWTHIAVARDANLEVDRRVATMRPDLVYLGRWTS